MVAMYRQNIQFPAKDARLREDVHALGALVGEILREQCGEACLAVVEADRVAAIARREGEPGGEADLIARTQGRNPTEARDLVRAFATWFQVVNLAEKVHRIRRRRAYLVNAAGAQPGGLVDAMGRLRKSGHTLEQTLQLLQRIQVCPVFTAHPTESTRRTILRKQQRVAELMLGRLDPSMTPVERKKTWEQIRSEMISGWQTEDHPRELLTVADEREHVLFYLSEVLYRILPSFYEELAEALSSVFGAEVSPRELPCILRFGSWVGGDMDGNPDVHAKTIRETLQRHQLVIVNSYFLEVQRLGERLSQSASRVEISSALRARIAEYSVLVPQASETAPVRHDQMPYRMFCAQIAERLRNTYEARSNRYESAAQLLADVQLVADSLSANRGERAGLFYVDRLLRRIVTFGFHLASLDVRQHALIHRLVIGQGLGDPNFSDRSVPERLERIRRALEREEGPKYPLDAIGRRTLAVFEQFSHCRHRFGREAIGNYVISGAEGADDVLGVLLLARWAELIDKRVGEVPLDVSPLFESNAALAASGSIMAQLFTDPLYQRHVAARGNSQAVMIGYSDSNKEAGYAAARWALYEAQGLLTAAVRDVGVNMTVSHDRGTVGSRSTSRPESLLKSVPDDSFNGVLRVTEQGEVVDNSYGLQPIAMRSLEQAVGFTALTCVRRAAATTINPVFTQVLNSIAVASRIEYQRLVVSQPDFFEYFKACTPIDVIERMQIGSRPVMRQNDAGFQGLRAVPWGFAWSQSRHLLPGWYGIGAGLDAAEREHGASVLEAMVAQWPFFSLLLDDAEFVLAKSDMDIATRYSELAGELSDQYLPKIKAEYARAEAWVLKLRGEARLLDSEPTLQRAIKLRNPYVDPIHLMQVDMLRRWRKSDRLDNDVLKALTASVTGIAQGLQATS